MQTETRQGKGAENAIKSTENSGKKRAKIVESCVATIIE